MIEIKCSTGSALKLSHLIPFQGDLKKRSALDIEELAMNIESNGLLTPIAIWSHGGQEHIIDGHARREALAFLAAKDPTIHDVLIPVFVIEAETEEQAAEQLLQMNSRYGNITPQGFRTFVVAKCPNIKVEPKRIGISIPKIEVETKDYAISPEQKKDQALVKDRVLIRMKVDADKVLELRNILKTVPFVEVL